jgi:hypothetical protein
MNRVIVRTAGILAALTLSATIALAAPPKPAAAKCPACGMFLAKKPTDKSTVAVRLKKGGPVMYCCSGCKMPASMLVKAKGAKKDTKM